VVELVHHRVATDERAAAKIAFNAGVDMEMVSNTYLDHMESLLESGEVNHERLDDAVRRILTVKFRLGLFEQPYVDPQEASRVQFSDENRALARKAAGQAMVLLQNKDAILPLPKDLPSLAVIGPLASERMALLGSWTLDGLPDETQTLVEAVRAACPQTQVFDVSGSLTDEMLMAAADATAIILAVGESNQRNGEHNNVASLDLPAGQEALVEHVAGLGKPVILVVFAGRPVNLWRLQRFADAILYAWHPGTMGAAAAADVIFGDANPSGRLPVSFPRSEGHIPAHYNHKSTGRSLRYVDSLATPLYPFGYGISYTRFSYSNLSVTPSEIGPAETVTVSVTLTNSGERPGDEVVQCYIQDVVASLTRPVRELKGFQRVSLGPGESAEVQFKLGPRQLSFVGRNNRREVEPGLFLVWVGGDSQAELETRFWVK
ncbi:MAG TPA: glycoside hydrolase family 3 C-terminal domain-containing protein, partial [Levilinea sp.]|nr:glycoside hydrolase family 3 C-terminal domain-containing protein [Levilinea sp.]